MNTPSSASISLDENLIDLGDVPGELPLKRGRKINKVTVWRWAKHGLAGVDPLETIRVGNALFTSREALKRFSDRVGRARNDRRSPDPTRAGSKAADRANAELAAAGL